MELFLRRAGPAPGEAASGTIVFVHGFPLDGSMWDHQLAALPPGWRGLAPDLRGFGQSRAVATPGSVPTGRKTGGRIARRDELVLTMRVLARDLAAVIEHEVQGPVVLCGLSMGGYVAFELWRRNPELVRALILADTRAEADGDEGRENRMRMAQVVRNAGAEPIAAAMLPGLLTQATREHRRDTVDHVRRMILQTPPATLIGALAGMASRRDSTDDLASISVPTLILVGADDPITPVDNARTMDDRIPDARLEIIDHAAHLTPLEQPEVLNRLISDFLRSL